MLINPPNPSRSALAPSQRGAAGALAALACAALISACGSSGSSSSSTAAKTNLDTTRVARSIEQSILTERHLKSTVTCPSAVVQEQGKTFECVAAVSSASKPIKVTKTTFVVTVKNDKGYVTYVGK
jgi:ABC-type glycerol-3-phosphate transport system substrate-binding protein